MLICYIVFLGDLCWHVRINLSVGKYANSDIMYIIARSNVLIETKQCLVMVRFLNFMANLTFLDVAKFSNCFGLTFMSKTASFKHVFDKVLRAK